MVTRLVSSFPGSPRHAAHRGLLATCTLAAMLAAAPAWAGTASSGFRVKVDLVTETKTAVQCDRTATSTTDGNNVNITCLAETPAAPVASVREADPRFLLHLTREGAPVGTVDGITPPGTVTSWRVLNFANREYLEIVVGW